MNKPPLFPFAPKEYSADQINQFARVLTLYLSQVAADVNAATNGVIAETAISVNSDFAISDGYNGVSVSPVTIATGVTVTIPTGSIWAIID